MCTHCPSGSLSCRFSRRNLWYLYVLRVKWLVYFAICYVSCMTVHIIGQYSLTVPLTLVAAVPTILNASDSYMLSLDFVRMFWD